MENFEKIEDLEFNGTKIIQDSRYYSFTSDSILLCNFARIKHCDTLLDIGCGNGVIAIYAAAKYQPKKVVGVEIQSETAALAKRSVKLNNLENIVEIANADINEYVKKCKEQFSAVICNPPYKKAGASFKNEDESKAIARHEITLNLTSLCNAVKRLMKFGGKLYLSYDASRSAELISTLKANGLEPKTILFTQSSTNSPASLILVEAVLGGKEGVKVLPVLVTNDENGNYIRNLKPRGL